MKNCRLMILFTFLLFQVLPDGTVVKVNRTVISDTSDDGSFFFHSTSFHDFHPPNAPEEDEEEKETEVEEESPEKETEEEEEENDENPAEDSFGEYEGTEVEEKEDEDYDSDEVPLLTADEAVDDENVGGDSESTGIDEGLIQ